MGRWKNTRHVRAGLALPDAWPRLGHHDGDISVRTRSISIASQTRRKSSVGCDERLGWWPHLNRESCERSCNWMSRSQQTACFILEVFVEGLKSFMASGWHVMRSYLFVGSLDGI